MKRSTIALALLPAAGAALILTVGLSGAPARAVPSFAQQTGQPCQACHVGGFGPQLTPFGRAFKLGGYTLRVKASVPLSAMAIGSFTSTKVTPPAPSSADFHANNNLAFDQGSIFLAGGIGNHFGGFVQTTYNGVGKAWSWDNLDLRAVNTGTIGGKDIVYGLTLSNNPGITDVWNTLPAWGFPYTSSALAPRPAAATLISGGLAQNVLGVTAYAWLDSKLYAEAGGYSSPSAGTLNWLGSDAFSPGDIRGIAPYGRIAYETPLAGGTVQLGGFVLAAQLHPGRDRLTGLTDHYTDIGADGSWLRNFGPDTLTFNARYTHENRRMDATCALGIADGSIIVPPGVNCAAGSLHEVRADASYYWRGKIGLTVGAVRLAGPANAALYPNSRTASPNSSAVELQLDGTPWGAGDGPFGPRAAVRIGVQYTAYGQFNGASHNYDGAGSNAADNNTLRIFTWVAF